METEESPGLEVRTYFVRGRNALIARADFGDLYVDYYLHQGQLGYQYTPDQDGMLKSALAAMVLHCASRPWTEQWAWTLHFAEPTLNLFVTGDNRRRSVVGHIFTEYAKDEARNLFLALMSRDRGEPRRSAVEFEGTDIFRAVEQYYAQSEQRPARLFAYGPEDFVMISAQPQCDLEWLASLNDEAIRSLDEQEQLSLLEQRHYRWECGCSHEWMCEKLAAAMRADPEGLFGEETLLRVTCPRCGARHTITREAMEAYVSE